MINDNRVRVTDQYPVDTGVEDSHIAYYDVLTILDVDTIVEQSRWAFNDDVCQVDQ